jgi:tRNA A-37 threonylcarbamoyl transferase component Bud32
MDIQVGQTLDKYELLERVGQGGMAIVYRGIDRSLKRVVAIKVLHKHLADYQEARDRFEREAQAVAKLRHENILEIFDFSAKPNSEAYIVTEFIDGQTLKQVITARPIAYPEIGAMLILQVGRALAHAHAGGILHRDVKPENIMIRSDGVVKLMDFGISHMVDLERLTVTGQLLGSPAYMAPEHVEGRPLDFRTDVFALGIVLYQLCVGKLPFEGKNPHEVLKRIAECRFNDPRTANPRIGNRLGRIILRAMAREPADRYAAIGEMVTALEGYLDESGIASDKLAGELARYFTGPGAYEQALNTRLVDHLTRRGTELLAKDERAPALDVFDRVLTLDPKNEKVLAILDGLNRRQLWTRLALVAGAAAVIGGGAFMIHKKTEPPGAESPVVTEPSTPIWGHRYAQVSREDLPPPIPVEDAAIVAPPDATQVAVGSNNDNNGGGRPAIPDAGVVEPRPQTFEVVVKAFPAKDTQIDFGDGNWIKFTEGMTRTLSSRTKVRARNPCCIVEEEDVAFGQGIVDFDLRYKPASITPKCVDTSVIVSVGTKNAMRQASLDQRVVVTFESTFDIETRIVEFTTPDNKYPAKTVTLKPGDAVDVTCGD